MKIENLRKFEYCCQDTQELLVFYILYHEELTADERLEVGKHLDLCPACREDYLGMKHTCDVLRANREQLISSGVFSKHPEPSFQQELTHDEIMERRFQDKLHRASIRRQRRGRKERISSFKRLLRPISAIAACLVICFGVFFAINQCRENINNPSLIASNPQQSSVKIELISSRGTEIIQAGQLIAAVDGLKTFRIDNNRQMVMNVGTELLIEPLTIDDGLGCLVKLDKGEIFTQVEHDGKPFIVETRHARAIITGTTFNVKANSEKMELAVVEGSVRFESVKGVVSVQRGYQSSVALGNRPSEPAHCDVVQVAAWATQQGLNEVVRAGSEMPELTAASMTYRNLEDINYDKWIMENQPWFEREFPWTITLRASLLKDGIAADTLDLMTKSGALWQFQYPEESRTQLLGKSSVYVAEAAEKCGYDKTCLNTRRYLESLSITQTHDTAIKAFERWLSALEKFSPDTQVDGELFLSSIHASVYLRNTRSLLWFNLRNDRIQLAGEDKQKVMDLLQTQVQLAYECTMQLKELFFMDNKLSICKTGQYQENLRLIKEGIGAIKEKENRLGVYEISGK